MPASVRQWQIWGRSHVVRGSISTTWTFAGLSGDPTTHCFSKPKTQSAASECYANGMRWLLNSFPLLFGSFSLELLLKKILKWGLWSEHSNLIIYKILWGFCSFTMHLLKLLTVYVMCLMWSGHAFFTSFQVWSKRLIQKCSSKHNKVNSAIKQGWHKISGLLNIAMCLNIFPVLPLVGTHKPDYG